MAKDALVLMVVSVNSSWEIPCGYFFVDGLSGIERANLVKICFEKLHDVGVNVLSLKCDGPSCHFSMLTELGANLQPLNLKQYFLPPLDPKRRIYILLDVCHMLKLVRNTFGDGGILIKSEGNTIYRQFLVNLQRLQE